MSGNGSANSDNIITILDFDKLWDYNAPEKTEKKFRELIPGLKDHKDFEYQSAYLQLHTQIARTLGLQMKFDEAHKLLDEIDPMIDDKFYVAKIRYLLERGRTFRSSRQVERSRDLFIKAYELAVKYNEDNLAVDAAHMMGIIEPFEEAQRWNELAMDIAEKSEDRKAKKWLGPLYNNTAWNYHDNNDFEEALELFEKNVEWHTERNSKQELIIAKWSVARALRSLNKIDEALKMQTDLLNEINEKNLEDDPYVFEELGELFLIKGKKEESKKYFAMAYDLLSKDKWFVEYETERLDRIKELGEK
ncbi:MAG TPA: hypothetical protein PKA90_14565 [Ignavibacteria bacterium]|nr:hypothetical protein [Ignavibacteria bacterium]HMR41643.1 hypothetical protein [Ignavibacteria bacterium]